MSYASFDKYKTAKKGLKSALCQHSWTKQSLAVTQHVKAITVQSNFYYSLHIIKSAMRHN